MGTIENELHHRSKHRIKILGEVFTPEKYVQEMLDLLDNKLWSDENASFFEPCCGNGNIVIAIVNRRMQAMYKRHLKRNKDAAHLFAIAHTINNIWAIDIETNNVRECRTRIFRSVIAFIMNVQDLELQDLIKIHKKFLVHVACALYWHIRENETLSALSQTKDAESNAQKTKVGYRWFKKHGHKPLDMNLCWVEYFIQHQNKNSIPLI